MQGTSLLKLRSVIRYALVSVLVGISVISAGCVYGPGYYGPPPHRHYYPHYYDYYYYPHGNVYFRFTTGIYYYLDGGVWISASVLPSHIHIDVANRVRIRVDSDKPYLKHAEHVRIYKPKPNYRENVERSRKEREANQRWYKEYQKQPPKSQKNRKKKDRY